MKKIIPILIVGIFFLSSFGAVAFKVEQEIDETREFTHSVFAEYGTATWCGYCKYAHAALKKIYASGDYPFNFVSLVCDKNTDASARATEYNLYGYPTVWFDGGYKVNVGGSSGSESAYRSSINSCGSREVEDIDIDLSATWLGGTEVNIAITVHNNEATTYGGHVRVYITEIASSMGWKDTGGYLYTFPFLDWAFNQALSINAGGQWSDSMNWDGSANGFPSVTEDNLMIFAAVFNDEWNQGYSYPPSGNPFDAYFVDESASYRVGDNRAPNTPSSPNPSDGKTNVDINADMTWQGGDPDWFDTVTYDIYFGTTNPPPLVESDTEDTTYDPGTLEYETIYYWQIIATDPSEVTSEGPVWEFSTEANYPPSTPEITGPSRGIPGTQYSFTFVSEDSDGYDVYFYVDWGDGTFEEWEGPFPSGNIYRVGHTWDEKSTYTIRAKAKDVFGAESAFGSFEIEIPRSINPHKTIFEILFDRFPNAFPILRQILGL
ncbi:MAG: hypothetical protein AYK22_00375 [Thermoplasmatales archaeon SG8-52-3]|nr:MAG: hypothetical protein AYK22_00375 [Thermoplasmatales archaeon SG8-52-3]